MSTPTAYLFANGNAAFTDEQGRQIPELQADGWRGLHEFIRRYPQGEVRIQGADPLAPALVPRLLANIDLPDEKEQPMSDVITITETSRPAATFSAGVQPGASWRR